MWERNDVFSIQNSFLTIDEQAIIMPEALEKPEDRDTDELLERFKRSAKEAVEGKTSKIGEVKDRIEGKKQDH